MRCTARSFRCPSPRTSTNAPRSPSRNVSRTFLVSRSSKTRGGSTPYAPLASHVIGYMGRITAETKDFYQGHGYYLNERVGQFGIELSMEEELHGKWGYVTYEVDNASRIVREIRRVPPINGNDVQLTIDLDQQQYAEQALETTARAIRQQQVAINPLDPETNFELARVPRVPAGGAVQGAGRLGRGAELPERPDHRAGQLSDVRQPLVRSRPQRRQVRRDLPVGRRQRRSDRPRRVDPRQPGDPGPLQPRLDVQAVRGVRRARHRV